MRTGASVELVLLVPGLLGPAGVGANDPDVAQALLDGLDLDGLDRLLARAVDSVGPDSDGSIEPLVFQSFGHAVPRTGADWPVAAITALIDCDAGQGGIRMRADPVHLRADIADLVLFDADDADVSSDESRSLAQTVNDALRPDGPFIDAAHPNRWYVALDAPTRMATTPLTMATGARVSTVMPQGPDAPRWHRWMNEVQMALHECPANIERERRGAAPINSVWLWGAGSLPPAAEAPAPFVRVWSDDALVRSLARHAGVECSPMPAGAPEWLSRVPQPGAHLIVIDDLFPAMRRMDIEAWRSGLARVSASWAKPLLGALDRGTVARVSIREERGHRFTATRRGRFRWWRRKGLAQRIADAGVHGA